MTLTRIIETITNFCVDPKISIQQTFTLTQIQSLFPLVLVAFTSVSYMPGTAVSLFGSGSLFIDTLFAAIVFGTLNCH